MGPLEVHGEGPNRLSGRRLTPRSEPRSGDSGHDPLSRRTVGELLPPSYRPVPRPTHGPIGRSPTSGLRCVSGSDGRVFDRCGSVTLTVRVSTGPPPVDSGRRGPDQPSHRFPPTGTGVVTTFTPDPSVGDAGSRRCLRASDVGCPGRGPFSPRLTATPSTTGPTTSVFGGPSTVTVSTVSGPRRFVPVTSGVTPAGPRHRGTRRHGVLSGPRGPRNPRDPVSSSICRLMCSGRSGVYTWPGAEASSGRYFRSEAPGSRLLISHGTRRPTSASGPRSGPFGPPSCGRPSTPGCGSSRAGRGPGWVSDGPCDGGTIPIPSIRFCFRPRSQPPNSSNSYKIPQTLIKPSFYSSEVGSPMVLRLLLHPFCLHLRTISLSTGPRSGSQVQNFYPTNPPFSGL